MSATAQACGWLRPPRPIPAPPLPLLDVLGAAWLMEAPVHGVCWEGDVAGFALGDGSIALARAHWVGAPRIEAHEGGVRVTPATAPPPPVSRQKVHDGACLAIVGDGGGGFVTGGADGRLAHIPADGVVATLAEFPVQRIEVLVARVPGWRAASSGRVVHLTGPAGLVSEIELPAPASAMAFDPTGMWLAIAHDGGVTLWSAQSGTRTLHTEGRPCSVAWSPDGAHVVCGLQEMGLRGWRLADGRAFELSGGAGQQGSIGFTADGRLLAGSGAARVTCWRFDPPGPDGDPVACGLPASRMPVCRVACHPNHRLIAAGYRNGAVLLCQPGTEEVLFVRSSGLAAAADPAGAAISALAWSADGGRLAMATASGDISVVALPDRLFREAVPHTSITRAAS